MSIRPRIRFASFLSASILASALGIVPNGLAATPGAKPGFDGPLARGRYECWAAASIAGTLRLEITGDTSYAGNGKSGNYTYDARTRKISFQSGPWAGFYGGRLGSGKIGISSRPGGSYNTVCDLKS